MTGHPDHATQYQYTLVHGLDPLCCHVSLDHPTLIACHLCVLTVAFKMYDLDGDDKISRDELLAVLHMMVGANISEDQVTSLH